MFVTGCVNDALPGADRAVDDLVRRDSAGVEVAEVPGRMLSGLPEWRVAAEPSVVIGALDAEGPYVLHRIAGFARMANGEIAVADRSQEVRFFGPDGQHVRTVGGRGEGPGEFARVEFVAPVDAGLLVYDRELERVTVLGPDGALVDTRRWNPAGCPRRRYHMASFGCMPSGALRDGTVVTVQEASGSAPGMPRETSITPGLMRVLGVGTDDGIRQVDSLALPTQVYTQGDGDFMQISGRLFEAHAVHAIGPDAVALAKGDRYEIRFRDGAGRLVRILRVHRPAEPVTDAAVDSLMELPYWRIAYETAGAVDSIPHFSGLAFDPAGRLWVRDFEAMAAEEARWTVFDASGSPVARARTPWNIWGIRPGTEEVLMQERGDFGEERIVSYPIVRGEW